MRTAISCLILGSALLSPILAAPRLTCDEFSKGVTFSTSQAIGTWFLLHFRASQHPKDARCVQFIPTTHQERQNLKERFEKYVSEINSDNLVLKMQIPCVGESGMNNLTRDYYLEKLEVDGSYKTLQMPSPNEKLETTDSNRHEMRLKMVEKKYLAMMDCVEHFTFLLDKVSLEKDLDPALVKLMQIYMPQEFI